jgi:hypothetical protein
MAYLPGTTLPLEWFYWLAAIPLGLIVYAVYRVKKGPSDDEPPEGTPTTQRLGLVLKVDQNKTLQVGKLLEGVTLEGNDLCFSDPDIMDPLSDPLVPKIQKAPWVDVVPAQVIDAVGKLVEIWGIILHKGEYKCFSFADIASNVRGRFDPLPADPTAVGAHYVPMGRNASGLTTLLQSNTGKILLFGMIAFCFWLFGLVSGHVLHF